MTPEIEWCHSCGVEEIFLPLEHYRACGECGHVFKTEADLVQMDVERRGEFNDHDEMGEVWPLRGSEIHACPMCAHDF